MKKHISTKNKIELKERMNENKSQERSLSLDLAATNVANSDEF